MNFGSSPPNGRRTSHIGAELYPQVIRGRQMLGFEIKRTS